ncbi:MAG: LysM domain-containing protein [Pseudomonadota bacterium]
MRNGDSLARISAKFNVSVREIAHWNAIDPSALIHPGQSLVLHVDVTAART